MARRRPRNPTPQWVNWIVLAVLGIALLSKFGGNTPPEAPPTPQLDALKEQVQGNVVENVKARIMPADRNLLRSEVVKEGTGPAVVCGQKVTVVHELTIGEQSVEQSSKDKPLSFRTGLQEVIPALDLGVIGMRTGGTYKLTASPDLTYNNVTFRRDDVPVDENAAINVEIIATEPTIPNLPDSVFRVIDTKAGSGAPVLCGETVKLYVTVWGTDGKKRFSNKGEESKIIELSLGKSAVFMGLEFGSLSMLRGGSRMLIVPPDLQKTLTGSPTAIDFSLPKDQTVLVEIESVP